jgi:hypothetical protein
VPPKTIYVKDADLPLWGRVDKAVRVGAAADSVSALISAALRLYFAQYGDQGGGLFVLAPDDENPVSFDAGISALLTRDAASDTWDLWLDGDAYPDADPRRALGPGTPSEMVAAARAVMAEELGQGELEQAAARLRRALGIGDELTAGDGRTAGRAWALERAAPGELEAICELSHSEWVSLGSASDGAGDPWPTLPAEIARHRPPADPDGGSWEVRRDDFMVGFVDEACVVYEQILETERNVAT